MKYKQFIIKNFKGIEDMTFDLDKSPNANIYTLVGLNESGKTTILEAMNLFSIGNVGLKALKIPGSSVSDYDELIPISKRDNFNGIIKIDVTLTLENEDTAELNKYLFKNTEFKNIKPTKTLSFHKAFHYKDSKYINSKLTWSGLSVCKKSNSKKYTALGDKYHPETNLSLSGICLKLIPNILYFPNFLFDFPAQIALETKEKSTPKDLFYISLVQDILNSLDNDTNISTHLINRIKSKERGNKRSLERLIQLMEKKVTEVVFEAWNVIFKRKILDTKVIINYDLDENGLVYLEFAIEANDGIYQINERSLGFKWFFIFLLFTQFRPFRKDSPQGIIFLFDEPASNLHSSAQKQLLKSFENLIGNGKIIYTTHSHHLINPHWLESTYVVKNEGLRLEKMEEYDIKKTNIIIQPYKQFASTHPHNTAYFQPILDVLDYVPSNLENVPNCVFLEGKNDYYTLSYFKDVILEIDFDLNLSPSTSSSNMDVLISLYLGWGKNFLVLLDSDKEGKTQEARYKESFGISVEDQILTLEHIQASWKKVAMEKLFKPEELLSFQKTIYQDTTEFNKTHFNRSIQESLVKKQKFDFSEQTKENFSRVLLFLYSKLK
ncbi:AAA family ATPase [Pedobacter sp. PLR]|uniref:ATP-dependent nuclease n=1 Tax=Pedobacter sp. PLR TaxID=2994465 RepID=UPI002245F1F0|nr:AAA family ATPase [Pedobacter sp. PLR]MCX2454304.1 AAA family ATPase [Pedobacter sp. PLR]